MYNYLSKDVTASVGYDCIFRQVIFSVFFLLANFFASAWHLFDGSYAVISQ